MSVRWLGVTLKGAGVGVAVGGVFIGGYLASTSSFHFPWPAAAPEIGSLRGAEVSAEAKLRKTGDMMRFPDGSSVHYAIDHLSLTDGGRVVVQLHSTNEGPVSERCQLMLVHADFAEYSPYYGWIASGFSCHSDAPTQYTNIRLR